MGHSYNHGLVTSMKGAAVEAVRIVGLNTTNNTIAEQSAAGFVESSTINTGTGVVTLQFAFPYPPRLVICQPTLSGAATDDIITARYVTDSYDPDAGTLEIALAVDDAGGAPVVATPGATVELHVFLVFCRYTGLPA